MREIGLYVHIPFCKHKCYYCDFCSFSKSEKIHEKYVNALIKEITNYEFSLCNDNLIKDLDDDVIVKTIYFGGGTPSIINETYIEEILVAIRKKFNCSNDIEITIEVNPGTANVNKLNKYKSIGINRLSIGLQSTSDRLLKLIGRIHNFRQFENVYNMAREVGFSNINVDLMVGLPTQSLEEVSESLGEIIKMNPEHISVYSLILEEDTELKKLIDDGKIDLPDEDLERDMYWEVKETLQKNGYIHYEISNFCRKGFQSKHNTDCWNQKEYFGFGLSAHSYFNGIRYSNISDLDHYMENIENNKFYNNIQIEEIQDKVSKMNEYAILKLRMLEGLNLNKFDELFRVDFFEHYNDKIKKLQKKGLIGFDKGFIRLTDKGIDFANMVWAEFI